MQSPDLTQLFSALADPTRRAILARLAEGDAPVKDLAEPFDLSGPAITKHLKVLERAGLISRSRDGQLRPCRLEARALEPAAAWIEQYRAMWEDQLDRLAAHLDVVMGRTASPQQTKPGSSPKQRARRPARKREGARNARKKS